ncbi:MAG: hypothetical protein ACR2NP_21280 [Pirellulaceae bacterium]
MSNVSENPVGEDEPTFRFPYKTWQVLAGLFVVAILVTAWQWYARTYIAPATPIRWQEFSVDEAIEVQRQRRNMLVWIQPADEKLVRETQELLQRPAVQSAAWLQRPAARKITSRQVAEEDIERWVTQIGGQLMSGGFVMMETSDEPRWMPQATLSEESLVALISGPE